MPKSLVRRISNLEQKTPKGTLLRGKPPPEGHWAWKVAEEEHREQIKHYNHTMELIRKGYKEHKDPKIRIRAKTVTHFEYNEEEVKQNAARIAASFETPSEYRKAKAERIKSLRRLFSIEALEREIERSRER